MGGDCLLNIRRWESLWAILEAGNHGCPHSSGLGWRGLRLGFQELGLWRQNWCTGYLATLRTKSMGRKRDTETPVRFAKWQPRVYIKHGEETGKVPSDAYLRGFELRWFFKVLKTEPTAQLKSPPCTKHYARNFAHSIIFYYHTNSSSRCLCPVLLKRNQSLGLVTHPRLQRQEVIAEGLNPSSASLMVQVPLWDPDLCAHEESDGESPSCVSVIWILVRLCCPLAKYIISLCLSFFVRIWRWWYILHLVVLRIKMSWHI